MPIGGGMGTGGGSEGGGDVTLNEYFDDFGLLAAADPDAIVTSFATSTSPVTKSGAGLNGIIGAAAIDPPRSITLTLDNSPGAFSTTPIPITGTDVNGDAQTAQLTPSTADGNETLETDKTFRTVTSIAFPAQADTDGAFTVGTGSKIGLRHLPKTTDSIGVVIVAYHVSGAPIDFDQSGLLHPDNSPPNGSVTPIGFDPDGFTPHGVVYLEDLS